VIEDDREALIIAYKSAQMSPDPRTQNGAFLLTQDSAGTYRGVLGRNFGIEGADFSWHTVEKYDYILHAEESAILAAANMGVATKGATLYCPWYACMACARTIIGAGVARVVGHRDLFRFSVRTNPGWVRSTTRALELMDSAGVICEWVDGPIDAPSIRHAAQVWDPKSLTTEN
jgi:dCMP deaminase